MRHAAALVALVCGALAISTFRAAGLAAPFVAADDPKLTGGTGTIYLANYAKQLVAIDEATEKITAQIPLKTGLPWAARISRDGSRFYVQSADQEHFEVIDIATKQTLDTFTLSEGNAHVRALAFEVDPQNRFMMLVARRTTKLVDRFEIGEPMFVQYDLTAHKVVRTVPWQADPEPQYYYLTLRFSPDAKLLYVFSHEILIYDVERLEQVDSWDLSLPNEPGLGGFDLNSVDEGTDDPGFFTALFNTSDPVEHRPMLVVGRVNLGEKRVDFFPIGPPPEHREVSFAVGGDGSRGFVLLQDIRRYEFWTIDMAGKRLRDKVTFDSRPRMALRSSTNGKIVYIFEAGNTIDLYQADGFKHLRTIALDADMMYNTFHVVRPRALVARPRQL
jgi:hypothetical protein